MTREMYPASDQVRRAQRVEHESAGTEPAHAGGSASLQRAIPSVSRLSGRGNGPARIAAMQLMQQTYGNRALQRSLGRLALQRAPQVEEDAAKDCALTTFSGSNLVGKTVVADTQFTGSLDSINSHAAANNVNLHVTSSFRTSSNVKGAIVTPAKKSNHMAGHAIDMNVIYGDKKNKWCNSKCLDGKLPEGVKGFIEAIQSDSGLRWGGDFGDKDSVHIDDGLNVNDPAAWEERYKATQTARKSGCS